VASFDTGNGIRGFMDGDADEPGGQLVGPDTQQPLGGPAFVTESSPDRWSLGDHAPTAGPLSETIEVLAPSLHAQGTTPLGQFQRLSDCVNLQPGFLVLNDAEVWNPRCNPLQGSLPVLLIDKERVLLVGQRAAGRARGGDEAAVIPKVRRRLVAVLPGYVVAGFVFLHQAAGLDVFLESRDPRFIPMADVDVMAAGDGEMLARYAFALLNRSEIVAAPPSADLGPGQESFLAG